MPLLKQVQLWIFLHIPRMEDGNNFGVSVQRDCVGEIDGMIDLLEYMLDSITTYYKLRGSVAAEVWLLRTAQEIGSGAFRVERSDPGTERN